MLENEERELADRFLRWLQGRGVDNFPDTHAAIHSAATDLNSYHPDLWKAFRLLVVMARIKRNSRNGRKGFRLVDLRPLTEPARNEASAPVCSPEVCPILRNLSRSFPGFEAVNFKPKIPPGYLEAGG